MIKRNPKNLKELEERVGKIVVIKIGKDIMECTYFGLVDGQHEFLSQQFESEEGYTEFIEGYRIEGNLNFLGNVVFLGRIPESFIYAPTDSGYQERFSVMKENERWKSPGTKLNLSLIN